VRNVGSNIPEEWDQKNDNKADPEQIETDTAPLVMHQIHHLSHMPASWFRQGASNGGSHRILASAVTLG
jgi:hypothetical protein